MELKLHADNALDPIDGAPPPPPSASPEDQAAATEQDAKLTVVTDVDSASFDSGGELTLSPPPIPATAALSARLAHVHRTNSFVSNSSGTHNSNTASPLRLAAAANVTTTSGSSSSGGVKPQQVFFIKTVRVVMIVYFPFIMY